MASGDDMSNGESDDPCTNYHDVAFFLLDHAGERSECELEELGMPVGSLSSSSVRKMR